MNWDKYLMEMAALVSTASKDSSTSVGAVIVAPDHSVRSTGYNGFPRGVNDDIKERHQRPLKYSWTVHAEQNAICQAAKSGTHLDGCTIYINGLPPCSICARLIIQSGIKRVVYSNNFVPEKWIGEWNISKEMFLEAGVKFANI